MSQRDAIDVIEVRRCANGYVLCAFFGGYNREHYQAHGYRTYVVESEDPEKVGAAIALALRNDPITLESAIPPARALP